MRHVVAIMLKWKEILHYHERQKISNSITWYLDMCSVQTAKVAIIILCQGRYFEKDINALNNGKHISKQSNIYKLGPFLDKKRHSSSWWKDKEILEYKLKHPVLLSRGGLITSVTMRYYHEKVAHAVRGITIDEFWSQVYWIINCTSAVKSMISKCIDCRWFRGKVCQQKMGDLPSDRLTQEPAFTYCDINMFGPFLVRDGCKQRKYYGAMFTCMSSRALHIETTSSIDSFILASRRLINWRGNVRMIHTDHGTNFVREDIELRKAFNEINHTKINNFLMGLGGEWITWHWNPPMAGNMGGVWEHQICSARNILNLLLRTHEEIINDESLRTWLVDVEGILNSRANNMWIHWWCK